MEFWREICGFQVATSSYNRYAPVSASSSTYQIKQDRRNKSPVNVNNSPFSSSSLLPSRSVCRFSYSLQYPGSPVWIERGGCHRVRRATPLRAPESALLVQARS